MFFAARHFISSMCHFWKQSDFSVHPKFLVQAWVINDLTNVYSSSCRIPFQTHFVAANVCFEIFRIYACWKVATDYRTSIYFCTSPFLVSECVLQIRRDVISGGPLILPCKSRPSCPTFDFKFCHGYDGGLGKGSLHYHICGFWLAFS